MDTPAVAPSRRRVGEGGSAHSRFACGHTVVSHVGAAALNRRLACGCCSDSIMGAVYSARAITYDAEATIADRSYPDNSICHTTPYSSVWTRAMGSLSTSRTLVPRRTQSFP